MKANEAPEKLYLHPTAKGKVGASWLTFPLTNEDIEYTHTDVFIEKTREWLRLNLSNYFDDTRDTFELFIDNFIKYLKEE